MPGQKRAHDERSRAHAPHPPIFKSCRILLRSSMGECKGIGERNERSERRRLKQADGHYRPKPMGCQVQERGACGQNGTNSDFCSKGPETIRQTPGNWTTYKSQCSCRTPARTRPPRALAHVLQEKPARMARQIRTH